MNAGLKSFRKKEEVHYNSMIDEFRRFKTIHFKKKFPSTDEIAKIFEILKKSLRIAFKTNIDFKKGDSFIMKSKGINVRYTVKESCEVTNTVFLEWNIDHDFYSLKFNINKPSFGRQNNYQLIFTQSLEREKTIYGLSDTIGLILYEKNFKNNMKSIWRCMRQSYLEKNSNLNYSFMENRNKFIKFSKVYSFSQKENKSLDLIVQALKKTHKIKKNLVVGNNYGSHFRRGIVFKVIKIEQSSKKIKYTWNDGINFFKNEIVLLEKNKFKFSQEIERTRWDSFLINYYQKKHWKEIFIEEFNCLKTNF